MIKVKILDSGNYDLAGRSGTLCSGFFISPYLLK